MGGRLLQGAPEADGRVDSERQCRVVDFRVVNCNWKKNQMFYKYLFSLLYNNLCVYLFLYIFYDAIIVLKLDLKIFIYFKNKNANCRVFSFIIEG